ncbi:ATPase [Calderihabitans maritimus]|uniref:ATPase n=1 Tax=Calderihabitans maritimus TaxID=1246530 RepID=A0A1Z5HPE5_9FIRM|nr:ATPase [Calderihabitans maritimus]GAW91402.1 hypothetical protein Desku_1255 [Calderihabitans maritimus]
MDVFKLLDQLENMIENSTRIPMTGKILLMAEEVLEVIDNIRAALPEELRQARWISKERERVLQQAQEEAQRIIEEAKKEIEKMANESEVTRQANAQAEEIINQAKNVAREIKIGAADYADDILNNLELNLEKALTIIRKGRQELQSSKVKNVS